MRNWTSREGFHFNDPTLSVEAVRREATEIKEPVPHTEAALREVTEIKATAQGAKEQ